MEADIVKLDYSLSLSINNAYVGNSSKTET